MIAFVLIISFFQAWWGGGSSSVSGVVSGGLLYFFSLGFLRLRRSFFNLRFFSRSSDSGGSERAL